MSLDLRTRLPPGLLGPLQMTATCDAVAQQVKTQADMPSLMLDAVLVLASPSASWDRPGKAVDDDLMLRVSAPPWETG